MPDTTTEKPPELGGLVPPWFSKTWEKLVDYLLGQRLVDSDDIYLVDAEGRGKQAKLRVNAGDLISRFQLEVYDSTKGGPTAKISVWPGQVYSGGSWTPKIGSDFINIDPPPRLTVTEADTHVYIELTLNSGGIVDNSANVKVLVGAGVPASDDTHAYVQLATIIVTGGAKPRVKVSPSISSSLSHVRCTDWFSYPIEYTHNIARI